MPRTGTARSQVNRQPVRRRADLAEAVRVTVFSPEDLALVQGGPAGRAATISTRRWSTGTRGSRHS